MVQEPLCLPPTVDQRQVFHIRIRSDRSRASVEWICPTRVIAESLVVGRRTGVAGISPSRRALLRPAGAQVAEQSDEWATAGPFTSLELVTRAPERSGPPIEASDQETVVTPSVKQEDPRWSFVHHISGHYSREQIPVLSPYSKVSSAHANLRR